MNFPFPSLKKAIIAGLGLLALVAASYAQDPTLVVVNGASFKQLQPLAPGAIASAFPIAANGFTGAPQADAPGLPLPTTLGGVQVLVNDVPSGLFFTSPGQINFQVSFLVTLYEELSVSVKMNGTEVARGKMVVFPASPGVFIADFGQPDPKPGAILNEAYQLVTADNPAPKNSVLQIYCNGLGALNGGLGDGTAAPSDPALQTQATPEVYIGGFKANVEFSGAAPGFAGLNQVNAKIPAQVLPGANLLTIIVDGQPSESVVVWIAQ